MITITAGMTGAEFIAALNNIGKVYNVKDYGAVGNNSTDDTVAIQAAINAAYTAGGGMVWFPLGRYVIGGALQTNIGGINYKSQLYIPDANSTVVTRSCVTLMGECSPNFLQTAGPGSSIPLYQTTSGVILRSTLESATALSYVIASKGAAGNAIAGINYNQCNIENIQIHITADASSQLTLGGVGFNDAAHAIVKNVCVFPANINLNDSAAAINNAIGIAMPRVNSEHLNILENCNVGGFESGYLLGDHTSLKDCMASCCTYGYNFGANYLYVNATKIEANWCINAVHFSGAAHVKINGLNVETGEFTKWYDYVRVVSDASNQGRGEIHYYISTSGVGFNNAIFAKSGGTGLQCIPLSFATAAEFTVTGARDETEGALASLLTALAAKGIIIDSSTAS